MAGSNWRLDESWSHRAGMSIALMASFLTLWTTIVRDDGDGIGYLMLILAAGVGAFAAWFRPAGMARAMGGVAIMQALLGVAIATAPVTVSLPGGAPKVLLFNGFFTMLWLVSALFFRAAARTDRGVATVRP